MIITLVIYVKKHVLLKYEIIATRQGIIKDQIVRKVN